MAESLTNQELVEAVRAKLPEGVTCTESDVHRARREDRLAPRPQRKGPLYLFSAANVDQVVTFCRSIRRRAPAKAAS